MPMHCRLHIRRGGKARSDGSPTPSNRILSWNLSDRLTERPFSTSDVATVALWLRQRRHGRLWPILLAANAVVLITFTMTITYERAIELAGFAFLCAGTFMDWRAARGRGRPLD